MTFVRVAALSDLPEGEVRVFEAASRSLALANLKGEIFALGNVCTHDGGPLGEGGIWGESVECPRHGARFDVRSGRVTALPAVLPCATYSVEVDGDEIKVDIG